MWEESTHGDELGELPFQKTKERANPQWGMPLKPDSHSSMSRLSRRAERHKILLDRMNRVQNREHKTSEVPGYSSVEGYNPGKLELPDPNKELSNSNSRSNRKLYGHYKRPQWPERTYREQQKHTFTSRDGPNKKGSSVWKSTSREQQDRIKADYLVALEFERKEACRLHAQLAEAKRERGHDDEPRSGKSALKVTVAECAKFVKKAKKEARSAQLPKWSRLRKAMHDDGESSDPSDSSSGTESDGSINYRGRNLFRKAPESDHSSDSEGIRRHKHEKRRRHRAKLQELKYQQTFLNQDPPFEYSGEVQASLFKKWVREVRSWIKRGRLSTKQGIELSGKYCSGKAYKFFERDILNARKKYTLAEYFEAMFDYLFPATFRMDQRDKFDACTQHDMSALDFLRQLQEIADTVGDLDDGDIILGFWRRCKSYLKSKLAEAGLEPGRITVTELEYLVVRLETAHLISEAAREHSDDDASEWSQVSDQVVNHEPNPESGTSLFGDKKRVQRLRNEHRCFRCESNMHLLVDCPETPKDSTIDSDESHTGSVGRKANIHDDAEDSDGPPQRNLHSGQSGSSSEQSGIDSDQNASQMSMVSSLESNGEED
jgi:hypothetical protein